MPSELQYRYPGIYSFTSDQNSVFFGRQVDIRKLLTLIEVESEVLLYAKSGIGKTSLLNAGVFPLLPEGYLPLMVRFYASAEDHKNPLDTLISLLNDKFSDLQSEPNELLEALDSGSNVLWLFLKRLQFASTGDRTLVLFFDQFEELFSYSKEEIDTFKNELYQATKVSIPADLMKKISVLRKERRDLFNAETLKQLKEEMPIKLVFSIRTDRLAFLDQMVDRFRNIRSNFLELQPLTETGARDSIMAPAHVEGEYQSKKFEYAPAAIERILDFLSNNGQKSIESTQLQIVCQQIEKNEVIGKNNTQISPNDLPNFEGIFRNFYLDAIAKLNGKQKEKAEDLIENQLIRNEQRISLDEEVCKDESSKNPLLQSSLDTLVDARLLRREPNSFGRSSYELAHDTLIPPIVQIAEIKKLRDDEIKAEEERQNAFEEKQKTYEEDKRKSEIRRFRILIVVVLGLFLISSFVAYNIYNQKKAAVLAQDKAMAEQERAKIQLEKADNLRHEANLEAERAKHAAFAAKQQEQLALKQSQEALAAQERAERASQLAQQQKSYALEAEQAARLSQEVALKQKELADEALAEQERLNRIAFAREIATNSEYETNTRIRALMARQAALIFEHNSSDNYEPIIYRALLLAVQELPNTQSILIDFRHIRSIDHHPSIDVLYVASGNGLVYKVLPDFKQEFEFNSNLLISEPIVSSTLSGSGEFLLTTTANTWNLSSTLKIDATVREGALVNGGSIIPHIKQNQFFLLDQSQVKLVDGSGEITIVKDFQQLIRSASLYPSSKGGFYLMAAALENGEVHLFSTHDGRVEIIDIPENREAVSVAFSSDSEYLAIGFKDGGFIVQRTDGLTVYKADPHRSRVNNLKFSPDNRFLISTSWDESIAITEWSTNNSVPLRIDNFVNKYGVFDFSSDGKTLLVASDSEIRSIPLGLQVLMDEICLQIDLNFSEDEWDKYIGPNSTYELTCESKPMKNDEE